MESTQDNKSKKSIRDKCPECSFHGKNFRDLVNHLDKKHPRKYVIVMDFKSIKHDGKYYNLGRK